MAAARAALKLRPAKAQEEAPAPAPHGVKGKVPRPAAASSKMASGQENPPKAVEEAATGEATIGKAEAADAAPAEGKRLAELPSDEVMYVPPKYGSMDPDSEEAKPWAVKTGPTTRLPQEEVDLVLSWEPVCIEPYDEETRRRLFPDEPFEEAMENMREAAEISRESMQDFIEYQDWIRGQMEDKGYVEVPIKFLQDRAEFAEWVQRDLEEMMKSIHIPAKCFGRSG